MNQDVLYIKSKLLRL